jgi:tetratricopeptide (TPR) repeat protein
MRWLTPLALALLLPLSVARAQAPEEDPVALASLLIQDGKLDRAAAVLDGVGPDDPGVDAARYWTLRGLVWMRQDLPADAARAFASAVAGSEPPVDPQLHLSLARAHVRAGADREALAALDAGGAALDVLPGRFLVAARAHWNLDELPEAWAALESGAQRFPTQPDFPRQQVLLLVEMGLTREAGDRASALLERADGGADDALTVAEAMRRAGAHDRAGTVLEEARLRFPDDTRLDIQLAAVHADAGRPLAAARLLQPVAYADPDLADETAELFRRAGNLDAALMMNAEVPDALTKVRQRFGLLLDAGAWERAVALQPRLSRLGLLEDDRVRYGVAYAWFQVGGLDEAEALLRGMSDPAVFRQATELRRAMEAQREGSP